MQFEKDFDSLSPNVYLLLPEVGQTSAFVCFEGLMCTFTQRLVRA